MSIKSDIFFKNSSLGFGELLYSLRITDEISQAQLARKLSVSRGYICDIEKGRKTAPVNLVVKIANAMGYSKEAMIQQLFNDQLRAANLQLRVKISAAS